MPRHKESPYIRVATFSPDEVLPFVFTKAVRKELRAAGYKYDSEEWHNKSIHLFPICINGQQIQMPISMGSQRYQLFAEKGLMCANFVECGTVGLYFSLEYGWSNPPESMHFNLYGTNKYGNEVMLTRDHIIPKSKGGANSMQNYQVLCQKCNAKKADKYGNSNVMSTSK